MSSTKPFTQAIRQWSEIFLQRSMRDFGHFMRAAGLSMPQVNTLMRLYHKHNCGVSDIGDHLGISNAAASQMVERLVQQGLLERIESPTDRRMKQLSLTARGRALVDQANEARHAWIATLGSALTHQQQTVIITALGYLTEAARAQAEGSEKKL